MDFFLVLFLFTEASSPPHIVAVRAQARITILRSHKASPDNWDPVAKRHQRELVKKETDGSEVRLRLTEFE